MLKYQRGVTMLGWLFLLTPLAIVGYAGVRLTPIYLNYMNVSQALKQVSTEVSGNSPTSEAIRRSLEAHLDVSGVTFPDVKDFKIAHVDGVWTVEAAYDDQAPLFANVFILVSFDKSVTLKASE